MQAPLFQRSSRFGYRRWRRPGWLLVRLAPDTPYPKPGDAPTYAPPRPQDWAIAGATVRITSSVAVVSFFILVSSFLIAVGVQRDAHPKMGAALNCIPPISRLAARAGLVTPRQTFVRRCHCGGGFGARRPAGVPRKNTGQIGGEY